MYPCPSTGLLSSSKPEGRRGGTFFRNLTLTALIKSAPPLTHTRHIQKIYSTYSLRGDHERRESSGVPCCTHFQTPVERPGMINSPIFFFIDFQKALCYPTVCTTLTFKLFSLHKLLLCLPVMQTMSHDRLCRETHDRHKQCRGPSP